ncbi:alpha/beta hydrolase family protein [Paucibacter soli]|uniref:alpha/beta hydrolase family protein n=1 Tax=Paucibacter soli TaxID=3133433 RepID=UPI0030B6CD5C
MIHKLRRALILASLFLLFACGGGSGPGTSEPAAGASDPTVDVLSSGSFRGKYSYQRLRLTLPGRMPAYAIWFPAPGASVATRSAAVLLADAYGGIDWTGERVDLGALQRAGSELFVMLEDIYGPGAGSPPTLYAPYDYSRLDDAAGAALPYLINGVAVIVVYQRFYAGGSLQNDIDDTLAGLAFLQAQPSVDGQRIAVWGSSYGGSLALHAAAAAPVGAAPAFGALSTPLVDYAQFEPYARWQEAAHSDPGKAILRLEPFRRRVEAAATPASGPADYAPYGSGFLVQRLKTKFLFIHDSFDTISPLLQANALYFGTPGRHQVFIYPHQGQSLDWSHFDITHAPVQPGFDEASAILFSQAYLLTRLVSGSVTEILLPRLPTLDVSLFAYLRAQQEQGYDATSFLLPRLLELCDARIRLVDYQDDFAARESGAHFVAGLLQTYWKLDVSEATVLAHLRSKGLAN